MLLIFDLFAYLLCCELLQYNIQLLFSVFECNLILRSKYSNNVSIDNKNFCVIGAAFGKWKRLVYRIWKCNTIEVSVIMSWKSDILVLNLNILYCAILSSFTEIYCTLYRIWSKRLLLEGTVDFILLVCTFRNFF